MVVLRVIGAAQTARLWRVGHGAVSVAYPPCLGRLPEFPATYRYSQAHSCVLRSSSECAPAACLVCPSLPHITPDPRCVCQICPPFRLSALNDGRDRARPLDPCLWQKTAPHTHNHSLRVNASSSILGWANVGLRF